VPGITIALARAATATVRGIIRSSGHASFGPFTFVAAREISGPQAYGHTATAIAAADGSFAIAGLRPGTYFVEARSPSESEFASKEVVVEGPEVAGVTLMLYRTSESRFKHPLTTSRDAKNRVRPQSQHTTTSNVLWLKMPCAPGRRSGPKWLLASAVVVRRSSLRQPPKSKATRR
jgi:hypothetical protein